MRLRRKTLIVFCLTFLSIGLIMIAASNLIMLSGFSKLEKQDMQLNVRRTLSAFSDEAANLDIITWDWASWDDTYRFIQDGNTEYVESNLVNGTFTDLEVNIMLYIDSNDEIVYGKAFDIENETEIPIPESLLRHLSENEVLTAHPDTSHNISGIVLLPEAPLLIASRPILTSEDEGPVRGTLIMGRFLDSSEFEQLSEMTHLSLTFYRVDEPQLPHDIREELSSFSDDANISVRIIDKDSIAGYSVLNDVHGEPALVFRVDRSRDIFMQGQASIHYFILSLSASFVVVGVVALLILERFILSRLASLSDTVGKIGAEGNFSMRVSIGGSDEISSLATDINWMLSALEKIQMELIQYANQLEEMVEEKSKKLLEAEQMITAGKIASMIGHDLKGPLQTIKFATHLLKNSEEDADEMLNMVEEAVNRAVQMLDELRYRTRDSPLDIVTTNLADLMKKAVEETQIPDSVNVTLKVGYGLTDVSLDPLKIRRVLDNLIGNAVDAMPRGGGLTMAAERDDGVVRIEVSDTGVGIIEEDIPNLFKPFRTTKPMGMGLGLAYCKRAVEAHGGKITTESKVGKGTTFAIVLPVRDETETLNPDLSIISKNAPAHDLDISYS